MNLYKFAKLPKADGVMLLDGNYGNSVMTLLSLDPNITEQDKGTNTNLRYDLKDSAQRQKQGSSSSYSSASVASYNQTQRRPLLTLMEKANERLALIEVGKGKFSDDKPFVLMSATQMHFYNKLFLKDLSLLSHAKKSRPVIKADGSIKNEVVRSVRAPFGVIGSSERLTASLNTTIRGFFSMCTISTDTNFRLNKDES